MLRLTFKNLWAHKTRLALSMLSIILGVSFLVGTFVISATLNQVFDDLFASVFKTTDAVVRSTDVQKGSFGSNDERTNVPQSLVAEIRSVDGVKIAEGNVLLDGLIVLDKDGKRLFSSNGAPTLGMNLGNDPELSQWRLIGPDGNSLSSKETVASKLSDTEIYLDKSSADSKNLKVGDIVRIITPNGPKDFTLAGLVRFGTADGTAGAPSFLFNENQAFMMSQKPNTYDSISVVGDDGLSQQQVVDRIKADIDKKYPEKYETITGKQITEENQNAIKQGLSFFTIALTAFAVISLLVALVIIINSFAIIMTQRQKEYALLRAVGATASQIFNSVLLESLMVGIFASTIGVFAGIGVSAGIKSAFAGLGVDLPSGPLVVPSSAIIVGLLVGTLATVFSACLPAFKAARIPPIAALRDSAFEKSRKWTLRIIITVLFGVAAASTIWFGLSGRADNKIAMTGLGIGIAFLTVIVAMPLLVRPFTLFVGSKIAGVFLVLFGGRRAFGITGVIGRRNNYRNPRRTGKTALALMMGVALVTFFTVFASSFTATFDSYLKKNFVGDFIISTDEFQPIVTPEQCKELAAQDYVAVSSCFKGGNVNWAISEQDKADMNNANGEFIFGVDANALPELYSTPFTGDLKNLGTNGIAISQRFADDHDAKLGTTIRIKLDKGTRDMKVKAILEKGIPYDFASLIIDNKAYNELSNLTTSTNAVVNLKDGVDPDQARTDLEKLFKNTGLAVNDQTSLRDAQLKQINQLLALIYVLLALSVIIAAIGIVNTMSLSILERRRELGLLRAVGVMKSQIRGFVRFESMIIAVLGTTIGMVFGLFGSFLIIEALKDEGIDKFAVQSQSLIVIVALSAIIGVVAGAWPAWRATKVDVLKAVTTE